MEKKHQFSLWYFFLAIALMFAIQEFIAAPHAANLSYSEFKQLVKAGQITEVSISEQSIAGKFNMDGLAKALPDSRVNELKKELKDGQTGSQEFTTVRVEDPDLVRDLEAAQVKFAGHIESRWLPMLLSWILPAVIFFALWGVMIKRIGGGVGGAGFLEIGKSKAKVYMEKGIATTFADVAGVDEAKEELQEIIEFLKNPQEYGRLGARIPKGILLVGPPGTGKTLLARAVAGEAAVPFFSINGSEFVEMFVGVGAARVRDLFEQARLKAPCIIFIDELDALGRARGIGPMSGGHDEKEQTLNQLLSELDGFDPTIGVVLLAATNRPEILDPALLRAGRFDRQILVDRPDKAGRIQILNVHLRKITLAKDVSVEQVAALTPGFTGADIANLANEAALLATRRHANEVSMRDLTEALERIVAGLEKRNRLLNERERKTVAYHESGHAIVALATPGSDAVHKVSIIPRGIGSLGYTIQRPTEDRFLMSKSELQNRMAILLGGRAAEELTFNEVSTGAHDDLAKATDIARSMVVRYGMAEQLGAVSYESAATPLLGPNEDSWRPRQYGEATATAIDAQVRALIDTALSRARQVLAQHRAILEEMAQRLLQQETLQSQELDAIKQRIAATAPGLSAVASS
jgi:cell division protease FtsH